MISMSDEWMMMMDDDDDDGGGGVGDDGATMAVRGRALHSALEVGHWRHQLASGRGRSSFGRLRPCCGALTPK